MTVGPSPFLMTAIGTRVAPQASSWGECGIMTKPTCLPALSKSTVTKALLERGGVMRRPIACSLEKRQLHIRSDGTVVAKYDRLGKRGFVDTRQAGCLPSSAVVDCRN